MIRIKPSGEIVVWFNIKGDGSDANLHKITMSLEQWIADAETMEGEEAFRAGFFINGVIEPLTDVDWNEICVTAVPKQRQVRKSKVASAGGAA